MRLLALGLALATSLAFAQGPMMGRGRGLGPGMGPGLGNAVGPGAAAGLARGVATFDELKAYLGLTDDQVTKLRDLRTGHVEDNQGLRQQVAEQHRLVRELMQRDNVTAAELGEAMLKLKNLQGQLWQGRDALHTQALAILTDAQKAKLKELEAAQALRPVIGQAMALHLLTPPAPGQGIGFGMQGFGRGFRR